MSKGEPKIVVNVPMSSAARERIVGQQQRWTGPRLVMLSVGTLAIALVVLYLMASTTSQTYWDDWLIPG
jgi:hypothetical protein